MGWVKGNYSCERTAESKRKKKRDETYAYGGASGACNVTGWVSWSRYRKQSWGDSLKP